jgi:hypothetical protein
VLVLAVKHVVWQISVSLCCVVLCCVDRKSFAIGALNSMKALHGVSKQAFKRSSHEENKAAILHHVTAILHDVTAILHAIDDNCPLCLPERAYSWMEHVCRTFMDGTRLR